MPTTLTEADAFDAATAPIGSDIRNAASVQSALQAQTNRSRHLTNRLEPLLNFAALKALVGVTNMMRSVAGYGTYFFDGGASDTEALPWIVQPNVGSGRWFHALIATKGSAGGLAVLDGSSKIAMSSLYTDVANGVPQLDGSVKVPAARLYNQILGTRSVVRTGTPTAAEYTTTSNVYADIPSFNLSFASMCKNGDELIVDCHFPYMSTGAGGVYARLVVDDGATVVNVAESENANLLNTYGVMYSCSFRYVLANVGTGGTGTVSVKGQLKSGTNGQSSSAYRNMSMTSMLVRP